jgi:hypothetical protein
MKRTIGWLTVDGDRVAENPFTGERLTLQKDIHNDSKKVIRAPKSSIGHRVFTFPAQFGDAITTGAWLLYEYSHGDLKFPVAISVLKLPDAHVVVIDYALSAELANGASAGKGEAQISYGLWRRFEEFVVDAVVLLKLELQQPLGNYGIVTIGGWTNGNWRADLFSSLTLSRDPRGFDAAAPKAPSEGYLLQDVVVPAPLSDDPPLPWLFRPLQEAADAVPGLPEDLLPVDYHLDFAAEPRSEWPRWDGFLVPLSLRMPMLTLSQRRSIIGRSPCVAASDDSRLLYMRSAELTGSEDNKYISYGYDARSDWVYADNELTCGFNFYSSSAGKFKGYSPSFVSGGVFNRALARVVDLRVRSQAAATRLDILIRNFNLDFAISVHRRVWSSISDGFLTWSGSSARHHLWSKDVSLEFPIYLWRPVYLFGYNNMASRCLWFDVGSKTERG